MFILSVIATILKIAGIVILVLLGITLLLLCIVLFVPIRYELSFSYNETGLRFNGRVTWLLHLVKVLFGYEKELSWSVALFGKPFFGSDVKKSRKKKKKVKKKKEQTYKPEKDVNKENNANKENESVSHTADSRQEGDSKEGSRERDNITEQKPVKQPADSKKEKKDHSKIISILKDKDTPETIGLTLAQVVRLIRAVLPKKIEGFIGFGTGDDYTEGKYLGIISMFYPVYAGKLTIIPYWGEEKLECDIHASGRLRLVLIAAIAIKLFTNKKFRKLISGLKNA